MSAKLMLRGVVVIGVLASAIGFAAARGADHHGRSVVAVDSGVAQEAVDSTTAAPKPFDPNALYGNVDQVALEDCIARGNGARCADSVPNLAECMKAGIRCRAEADPVKGSVLEPPDPNAPPITRDDVLAQAQRLLSDKKATVDELRAFRLFNALIFVVSDGAMAGTAPLPADRPVWVVVAQGKIPNDSANTNPLSAEPPPEFVSSYAIVYDALTGHVLQQCWDCLTSDQAAKAQSAAADLMSASSVDDSRSAAISAWERLGLGHGVAQASDSATSGTP
jgi:hypothetical protein